MTYKQIEEKLSALEDKVNELDLQVNWSEKFIEDIFSKKEKAKLESQPEECSHLQDAVIKRFKFLLTPETLRSFEAWQKNNTSQPEEQNCDACFKYRCEKHKDPSPKKECEHEFTKGWPSSVHCKKCGYGEMQLLDMEDLENSIKAKKVIYTSEGDAVGEVGSKWKPHKDETVYSINTQASNEDEIVYASTWGDRDWQKISMRLGVMFRTQEEANAKLKAMLGEVGGKE